jgi:hypothetical protein
LENADAVLRMGRCDLKGASYFSSQLPLLLDRKFNADRHIRILSDIKPYEPIDEIRECYKGVKFEIKHIDEIVEQFLKVKLFEKMDTKEGKTFEKTIENSDSSDIARELGINETKINKILIKKDNADNIIKKNIKK